MKRLLLIDGSNMLFRAYYAIPAHLSTSSGQPTNAVFGFVTMLGKLLSRKVPDFAAVVFDPPGGSFRHRQSADYKANRKHMPEDLAAQLELVDQAVGSFGFPVLRVDDFEADDVIATLARQAQHKEIEVIIVSSDKDFSQLLGDGITLYDGMRELTFDADLVYKKFGVTPAQFVDFQSLCGDKVDNIPGVPGIGGKTAAKLLADYGSLDQILDKVEQIPTRVGALLRQYRESALKSRELARLDSQVLLDLGWEDLAYAKPPQSQLNRLFSELEFYSLLKADEGGGGTANAGSIGREISVLKGPDDLHAWARGMDDIVVHLVALPVSFRFKAWGMALLCPSDGQVAFVPFDDAQRDTWGQFFQECRARIITHDFKALWRFFLEAGVTCPAEFWDTQTASYLIDPSGAIPHDLERVAKLKLQRVLPSFDELLGKGAKRKRMDEISVLDVASFSSHWVQAVFDLYKILSEEAEALGLADLCVQEVALSKVLARMELAGVGIDRLGLEALNKEFGERLQTLRACVIRLAGREFNVGSPKQLAEVLFEDLKLPVQKKTKTGYSTNAEVLEKLAVDHEICRVLLEYRKFEKLISAYVESLLQAIDPSTGRIHTMFGQTASTTGRLVTSEPDLQKTPVRTEEGRRIRRLFEAPIGCQLLVADWSQIELRVLAHLCHDPALVQAFHEGVDVHRRTAAGLFGKEPQEVTREERETAKTVNFATIYGQGASALAQNLGLSRKEAERIIERYFEVYSRVRSWLDQTVELARVTGKVTTLAGRTRFIPELFSKNPMVNQAGERMAWNTPVQGSAADICKQAMLRIDARLQKLTHFKSRLLLQIHDELVFECPENELEEVKAIVKFEMEHAWELDVPLVVSIGSALNWEQAKS